MLRLYVIALLIVPFFIWSETKVSNTEITDKINNKLTASQTLTVETIQTRVLAGIDLIQMEPDGTNLLMRTAAFNSDDAVIKNLLEVSPRIDLRDNNGVNALMYAAIFNSNPEILDVLIENGASIESTDYNQNTPLILAAKYLSLIHI